MKTRAEVREELQTVLTAALVGTGLPVAVVYKSQVDDFAGQSPVVGVFSGGSERKRLTRTTWAVTYYYLIMTRVLFEDPTAGATWGADEAEDAIDDIERRIAEVLLEKMIVHEPFWKHVGYTGRTQTTAEVIGGAEYRGEGIEIAVLVA